MATTYYVWSGATGTNAGTSWTNAYTAFGSAVTAASTAGDIILVHYTHQENLSTNTTYTFQANIEVRCVNKDSSDAPTAMGTSGWIGHNTTGRNLTLNGVRTLRIFGLSLRMQGGASLLVNTSDGAHFELESCRFWNGSTGDSFFFELGGFSNSYTKMINCVYDDDRTSAAGSQIRLGGRLEFYGLTCSVAAPSYSLAWLLDQATDQTIVVDFFGCDLSAIPASSTLIGNMARCPARFTFTQCKLPSTVTILATQSTHANLSQAAATVIDCSSGDTHGLFGYYDAMGSCVSDTAVYFTSGAAAQSWKITTSANVSSRTPFVTPWVSYYNSGTTAITPYIEVLRDGSTTAYNDNEVWAEFAVKTTASSTQASLSGDKGTGSAQADGAGLGSWTGEGGSAKSLKCDSGSSITPAEVGDISGRIYVAVASINGTLYVDPQIRT